MKHPYHALDFPDEGRCIGSPAPLLRCRVIVNEVAAFAKDPVGYHDRLAPRVETRHHPGDESDQARRRSRNVGRSR